MVNSRFPLRDVWAENPLSGFMPQTSWFTLAFVLVSDLQIKISGKDDIISSRMAYSSWYLHQTNQEASQKASQKAFVKAFVKKLEFFP